MHRNVACMLSLLVVAGCAGAKASVPMADVSTSPEPAPLPLTDAEEGFNQALSVYRSGNAETAHLLARRVRETFPGTPWYGRSLFLSLRSLLLLGRTPSAEAAMMRIQHEYPEMADYSVFLLAQHHASQQRFSRAAAFYGSLLERYPDSFLVEQAAMNHARALEQAGYHLQAADVYERFLERNRRSEHAADAALGLGRTRYAVGDVAGAASAYRQVLIHYPGSSRDDDAEEAIDRCRRSGATVVEMTAEEQAIRGRNLFRTLQYKKAYAAFSEALEAGLPASQRSEVLVKSGVSLFHLGKRAEATAVLERAMRDNDLADRRPEALNWIGKAYSRMGERQKAIDAYLKIVSSYPESRWADDALYLAGNVYRDANDPAKAEEFYARLADEFPDSSLADSALWWNAWSSYTSGDYTRAAERMGEIVRRYPRSFLAPQALFWMGRAIEQEGDAHGALSVYQKVLQQSPFSYYGYLAAERLQRLDKAGAGMLSGIPADAEYAPPAHTEEKETEEEETAEEETAEEDQEGPPVWTEETVRTLAAEAPFRTVLELMLQGMRDEAAAELWGLQFRRPRRRGTPLALSKAFYELGDYHRSLLLVLRSYERHLERPSSSISEDLWYLAYPRGYWDSVTAHAERYGQDPHFIAAIIRQESLFNAEALSPAGARGVMQIMPTTGEWAASMMRLKGFDRSALYGTDVNIQIGTWYVARLMTRFQNDQVLVAAAYNAGPGAVSGWMGRDNSELDRDEFVENIPFTETRWYVKRVLTNYAEYRRIYGRTGRSVRLLGRDGGSLAAMTAGEIVESDIP